MKKVTRKIKIFTNQNTLSIVNHIVEQVNDIYLTEEKIHVLKLDPSRHKKYLVTVEVRYLSE